jgi:D-alanyl-lipoteichoic acid acyltransferase DltB (MBOAT superfamily)
VNYNQFSFWAFFFIVLLVYRRLGHTAQNRLMLVASYFFYGFWDYRFLFLILISTVIDYVGGLGVAGRQVPRAKLIKLALGIIGSALLLCSDIRYGDLLRALFHADGSGALAALPHELRSFHVALGTAAVTLGYGAILPHLYRLPERKRRVYFLTLSMVANLGILGFFKYCDFFIDTLAALLTTAGLPTSLSTLGILLPAGISFYTFQAMSYTIDIYRGECEPTESLADFALFVCFFPHLVAGPIMRAHTLLPQVVTPRTVRPGDIEEGLWLVVLGLFKKVVIADNMAPIANAVFLRFAAGKAADVTGPEALVGLYAFAFQIYGDFSGYSSIARGISKWLGFELVVNFDTPYLAISPSDFWRRWHISLSSWLRDYLYIPLGGNRFGVRRQYRNLMITMLLGGLWHGASWTFVAWGFYHGALLCVFRLFHVQENISTDGWKGRLHWLWRVCIMFHLTCVGWLLFRADSFHTVLQMGGRILTNFQFTPAVFSALSLIAFYCLLLVLLEWVLSGELRIVRLLRAPRLVQGIVYAYFIGMMFFFHASRTYEFIYFQF